MRRFHKTNAAAWGCLLVIVSIFFSSGALAGEIQITLNSPPYSIMSEKGGHRIEIPGSGKIDEPGAPALPLNVYWAVLPPGVLADSLSLRVLEEKKMPLAGQYEIWPVTAISSAVGAESISKDTGKALVEKRNLTIFQQNAFFPDPSIRVDHVSQLQGIQLVRISFYPIQYNPISQKAVWTQNIKFELSFEESDIPNLNYLPTTSRIIDRRLPTPVLNIEDLDSWYPASDVGAEPMALTGDGYAIITTDSVKTTLYDASEGILYQFAGHKESLGYSVYLVTETQTIDHPGVTIGSGYGPETGQFRAVNIRNWLVANHVANQKNIKYALLIGHPDPDDPEDPADSFGDLPMVMCFPEFFPVGGSHGTPKAPTDYFYADLSGNWNLDGDSRFCEYNGDRGAGGVEFIPEIYVGRIPFSDSTRVAKVLQKVMDYESVSYSTTDNNSLVWRKKALLPMSILNFGSSAWGGVSR